MNRDSCNKILDNTEHGSQTFSSAVDVIMGTQSFSLINFHLKSLPTFPEKFATNMYI